MTLRPVTVTTTNKDGSTMKTETKANGSSTTERRDANGSIGTVRSDANGRTEVSAKISEKTVSDARASGSAVSVPAQVDAGQNSNSAPTVRIELPRSAGETKVEVPVRNGNAGTVAILVHEDGTEEIIRTSQTTATGVQFTIAGSATVKIVDNSKDFIDTRNHWARNAILTVSSRELFNGVSADRFAPNGTMTRAMVNTVLARLNGVDTFGGQTAYENGIAWAMEAGISDGTRPNDSISRQQLVTMLYRCAGTPALDGSVTPSAMLHRWNPMRKPPCSGRLSRTSFPERRTAVLLPRIRPPGLRLRPLWPGSCTSCKDTPIPNSLQ